VRVSLGNVAAIIVVALAGSGCDGLVSDAAATDASGTVTQSGATSDAGTGTQADLRGHEAGSGGAGGDPGTGDGVVVDAITLTDEAAIGARRQALRKFLWGTNELPAAEAVPTEMTEDCDFYMPDEITATVEELRVSMEGGEESHACHIVPSSPNGRLVVYNPGHICTVVDGSGLDSDDSTGHGDFRSIQTFLLNGYSVLVTYMPHYRPDQCGDFDIEPHMAMFARLQPAKGTVWKYFVEPIVASLNYLVHSAPSRGFPVYSSFNMVGLSGGGWTTVLTAAIDPRIQVSVQVAGSEPLDFWHDYTAPEEQTLPDLYRVAAYRDLYILGAGGAGRRHIQILNRRDSCCFFPGWNGTPADTWEASVTAYASAVEDRLASIGDAGTFELDIDDTAVTHEISRNAVASIILPALGRSGVVP
jgi:hypothetical protein